MADNSAAFASLDRLLDQLRSLEKDLAAEVAREARPLVEAVIKKRAAQGLDPDGIAWATKKDGSRALEGIEKHITCSVVDGTILQVTLTGGGVFHHNAKGSNSRPTRRVLPDGGSGLPKWFEDVVLEAAQRVWRRKMGG